MMDKKARTLLHCAMLLCLLAWRAAGGGETADVSGLHLLDKAVPDGWVLSTDADSAAERFQFCYHRSVFVAPGRRSYFVVVVERDGVETGAMFCMKNGMPFAHLSDGVLRSSFGSDRTELLGLPGALRFRASSIAETLKPCSVTNRLTRCSVHLDIAGILRDIRAGLQPLEFEPRTRRIALRKENGSTAIVRLPRERTPRGSPIAAIILQNADDEFAAITDILVHKEPCRRISKPYPNLAKLAPLVAEEAVVERYGSLQGAIGSILDERLIADLTDDVREYIKGGLMLRFMPVREDLAADERESIENAIKALHPRLAHYVVGDAWTQAYRDLNAILQERVVRPANLMDHGPGAVVRYVTGRDRHRTATSLETCLWPTRTERLYTLLAEITVNQGMSDEQRAMALDLLGEIGIPELSNGLVEVREALENDPPQLVRLALASVKARTGVPTDDDVKLLREAVADRTTPDRWRAVWLEALLLMDEAEGLQPVIADVLGRALDREGDEFAKRCLLAAGCSDDGREVLLRLARGDGKEPPPVELLRVLSTAIMPGDRQWDAWLALARQFAVAETLDADSRWIAENVMARADS